MQIEIFRKFETNMRRQEVIQNAMSKTDTEMKTPRDPCDPLLFERVVMD